MTIINILCIATEKETPECKEQYIEFKSTLQSKACQSSSLKVYDVHAIKKQGGDKEKLPDKLKKKIDSFPVIVLVCSPTLKAYLDSGKSQGSDLLASKEREVLLKELSKDKNKQKIIGVYLDKKHSGEVPNVLQGVEIIDGVNRMDEIVEVKIPPRVTK